MESAITGPALRQVREAIRICQACPIQVRCLAWALEQGVTDGVWGGTTAEQRRAIRRLADIRQDGGRRLTRRDALAGLFRAD